MTTHSDILETSEDAVLGGRLRLRQPLRGHRVGHDAILLAAATGGHAGERAVDLGAGVGAVGLTLALRVPALKVTLVEIDHALCALAAGNARLNGLADRVDVLNADVEDADALSPLSADRVLMNPPFHDESRQNVSPDPRRRLAHSGAPGLLPRWITTAARLLKPQGVLTLIWRADALVDVQEALAGAFGCIAVLAVHPRPNASAIRVLVRAVKSGHGALVNYPALVLNDEQGRPSAAAEAVLRGGEMLRIAEI
jgi:tRNA1(Val) A37 N6-methylase TrmN6